MTGCRSPLDGEAGITRFGFLFSLFKILEELTYLNAQINAFYVVHAFVGIYFFEMGRELMAAFC